MNIFDSRQLLFADSIKCYDIHILILIPGPDCIDYGQQSHVVGGRYSRKLKKKKKKTNISLSASNAIRYCRYGRYPRHLAKVNNEMQPMHTIMPRRLDGISPTNAQISNLRWAFNLRAARHCAQSDPIQYPGRTCFGESLSIMRRWLWLVVVSGWDCDLSQAVVVAWHNIT